MAASELVDLGARLKWARELSGLSPEALSIRAGLAKGHGRLIEMGKRRRISAETAQRLAAALGVSFEWLHSGAGERPTEEQIKQAIAGAA